MPPRNIKLTQRDARSVANNADATIVRNAFGSLNDIRSQGDTLLRLPGSSFATSLAAQQIIHQVEGWRYLAAAIQSFLAHSAGTCIHQAYYAELRAVFSLLSGSGILINNGANAYIESSGRRHSFVGPTHVATWMIWQEWVKTATAQDILKKGVSILPGVTLGDMIDELGGSHATRATLLDWGFDLVNLKRDHAARDRMSYDPYWQTTPLSNMAAGDVKFIRSLWPLLFPYTSGPCGFDIAYVRYLIRKSKLDNRGADPTFRSNTWYESLLNNVARAKGVTRNNLNQSLKGARYDLSLFEHAANNKTEAKNVLCRAIFLLRIAMLSLKMNLDNYDRTRQAGTKWLRLWMDHAGLWDATSGIGPADTVADYQDSLANFQPTGHLPYSLWSRDACYDTTKLARPDACLVWGLI
jgi:hypothetical protein